jgi:formate hydrogenlyase transcriptional activator
LTRSATFRWSCSRNSCAALQEQEFERLGGGRTISVNVRIVAATNQDLAELVSSRQFRADLYYRLNVIPIFLPPLRERADDIPRLVEHFVRKYADRLHKPIDTIPEEVMEFLQSHDWPGNIRELQNFIERAVVFSPGSVLRPTLTELRPVAKQPTAAAAQTFAEASRDHILEVLELSRWMIGGRDGAAERPGMPRTTLIYKMRKLGIEVRRPQRRRSVPLEPAFAGTGAPAALAAAF